MADPTVSAATTPATVPRITIDLSESEVLGLINKLTVALGHSWKYGKGEAFTTSAQIVDEDGPVSGALVVRVSKDGTT